MDLPTSHPTNPSLSSAPPHSISSPPSDSKSTKLPVSCFSPSSTLSPRSSKHPLPSSSGPWPTGPGVWLPTGYTMMKPVLSDPIALVRGDRFPTSSFSATLTTRGYHDTKREPNKCGLGGAFPKLLTRYLPRHHTFVSLVVLLLWYGTNIRFISIPSRVPLPSLFSKSGYRRWIDSRSRMKDMS